MEDQGVLSHQTFLAKNFPFLLPPRKQVHFQVSFDYTNRRFKAASCTFVKKNDTKLMYNIISKMNSTFGMIGKAMTDKLTETVDGKNSSFRFSVTRI